MGIDHAFFRRDALQGFELAAQFGARGGRLVGLFRLRQNLSDAPDIVDQRLLRGPFGFQAGELVLERRDILIEGRDPIGAVDPEIAVADERRPLGPAGGDG
jgi:hypothetical protein